jgi:hypothetical protein
MWTDPDSLWWQPVPFSNVVGSNPVPCGQSFSLLSGYYRMVALRALSRKHKTPQICDVGHMKDLEGVMLEQEVRSAKAAEAQASTY